MKTFYLLTAKLPAGSPTRSALFEIDRTLKAKSFSVEPNDIDNLVTFRRDKDNLTVEVRLFAETDRIGIKFFNAHGESFDLHIDDLDDIQPVRQNYIVGDKATFTVHTDSKAGYIIAVSKNGKQVTWQECKAELLNGANSGESDALHFSPGGFVGHTSGVQRWKIEADPNGRIEKFSARTLHDGSIRWKLVNHPTTSPGCYLNDGHHPHYDFNY